MIHGRIGCQIILPQREFYGSLQFSTRTTTEDVTRQWNLMLEANKRWHFNILKDKKRGLCHEWTNKSSCLKIHIFTLFTLITYIHFSHYELAVKAIPLLMFDFSSSTAIFSSPFS